MERLLKEKAFIFHDVKSALVWDEYYNLLPKLTQPKMSEDLPDAPVTDGQPTIWHRRSGDANICIHLRMYKRAFASPSTVSSSPSVTDDPSSFLTSALQIQNARI